MQTKFIGNITTKRRQQLTTAALLVVSFAVSRVIFWHIGVRFDSSSLDWFWQYLDLNVLRHNLMSGIFHMHSQPPGFNLFLGLVLKCFPNSSGLCFHVVYMLLGFILYCSLYLLLRLSAFSRTWAFVCSFLFIVSPSSILYENWLFYTYPIAVLLVVASIALHRCQERRSTFYAGAFLFIIAIVCLTRSAFHLVFILACVALVVIPREIRNRKVVSCAFATVCLVGTLYLKNLALFGFFGSSSWMGMNMFNIAQHSVGTNVVNELVRLGSIPSVASQPPFSAIDKYSKIDSPQLAPPGIDPLTTKTKASGTPNYNHADYVRIAQEYRQASSYIIRKNPRLYLSSVFDAWCLYCQPSWHNDFLKRNNQAMSVWLSSLSCLRTQGWIDLRPFKRWAFGAEGEKDLYPVTSLLFLPSIIVFACAGAAARISRFARKGDSSGVAFIFMTFTVIYVAVLGNAFEYGENNRFRVETDPLIFLLGAIIARDAYSYAMQRMFRRHANKSVDAYVSPGADTG